MKLIVLTRNEQPIYEQLFEQIRAQVLSGELQPHYCLPSIRTVSRELGISVIPVKTAYDLLEKDGYIYTVQGKGCFVAEVADRELLRTRLAADSVRNTVFCCKSLGYTVEEVTDLVSNAYIEPTD